MAKILVRLLSVLILCILTAGSLWNRRDSTESYVFTVEAAGGSIPAIIHLAQEAPPAKEPQETPFKTILVNSEFSIPYVQLGESIQIQLDKKISAAYELTDVLLREDGSYKYNIPNVKPELIKISSGAGTFELKTNMAAFLSSNTKDYEPGATIRGFKLTDTGDGEKTEYYFVLRTNAGSGSPSL